MLFRSDFGDLQLALNQLEDAKASYTNALALAPEFPPALARQGKASLKLGRFEEATSWLFRNKFFHLAALDAAIDENVQAYQWLQANSHPFLVVFADACRGKQAAINWFHENNMEAFILIAQRIKYLRDNTTFDYHKKKF